MHVAAHRHGLFDCDGAGWTLSPADTAAGAGFLIDPHRSVLSHGDGILRTAVRSAHAETAAGTFCQVGHRSPAHRMEAALFQVGTVAGKIHTHAAARAAEADFKEPVHFVVAAAPEHLFHFNPHPVGGKSQCGSTVTALHCFFHRQLIGDAVADQGTGAFSNHQTGQVVRIVFAVTGFPADTGPHAADEVGTLQSIPDQVQGNHRLFSLVGQVHIQGHHYRGRVLVPVGPDHGNLPVDAAERAAFFQQFGAFHRKVKDERHELQIPGTGTAVFLDEVENTQAVGWVLIWAIAVVLPGQTLFVQPEHIALPVDVTVHFRILPRPSGPDCSLSRNSRGDCHASAWSA